jgi:hypothetical protein
MIQFASFVAEPIFGLYSRIPCGAEFSAHHAIGTFTTAMPEGAGKLKKTSPGRTVAGAFDRGVQWETFRIGAA